MAINLQLIGGASGTGHPSRAQTPAGELVRSRIHGKPGLARSSGTPSGSSGRNTRYSDNAEGQPGRARLTEDSSRETPLPGVTSNNENDNSVVLAITLGQVVFVLTGDAEADGVWTHIASQIPANTRFFKVPHHGSANGIFTSVRNDALVKCCPGCRCGH